MSTDSGKSRNSPGWMPAVLPDAVQTISEICSSIGPSSVWIGLESFCLTARTLQPGSDSHEAETNPGGSRTSTFTVEASSRSFGTRTVSTVSAPAGADAGWTVTCAPAAAGATSAAASTVANGAILRFMGFGPLVGWEMSAPTPRPLPAGGVLVEGGDGVGARPPPVAAGDELEGVGDVVAGAG